MLIAPNLFDTHLFAGRTPRPYQMKNATEINRKLARGSRGILYVAATGAGKTFTSVMCIAELRRQHRTVLITVPKIEIARAWCRDLKKAGIDHGFIGQKSDPTSHPVHVAMLPTLAARLDQPSMRRFLAGIDVAFPDEAHHMPAETWARTYAAMTKAQRVGPTATPFRTDGGGLGLWFNDVVEAPSIAELEDDGYLLRTRLYEPVTNLDLRKIGVLAGEYKRKELEEEVKRSNVIPIGVKAYAHLAPGDPFLFWLPGLETCRLAVDALRADGWRAEMVSGKDSSDFRESMLGVDGALATGAVDVVCFADLVDEGVDIPVVSGVLNGRKTLSTQRYIQVNGRAKRPVWRSRVPDHRPARLAAIASSGQPHALMIDLVGNRRHHGMINAERKWTLAGGVKGLERVVEATKKCRRCSLVHVTSAVICEGCGAKLPAAAKSSLAMREDLPPGTSLSELTDDDIANASFKSVVAIAKTRDQLLRVAAARGLKRGWVDHILDQRNAWRQKAASGRR